MRHASSGVSSTYKLHSTALDASVFKGVDLVHAAFGMRDGPPLLAINRLDTQSLEGEQRGFVSLLKGLYGTIRNPLAHNSRLEWDMTEQDALDILTTISLVHRKLDLAYRSRS